jgi:predicted MPP superfamily phosphohydrolase
MTYIKHPRRLKWTIAVLLLIAIDYMIIEPNCIEFSRHEITIPNLPREFQGLTIVQLSDVHIGRCVRMEGVKQLVERVNAMHPDLVVLTGDYVNYHEIEIDHAGEALRGLRAKYGVYAVMGNHDYWTDGNRSIEMLRRCGFHVLINEKRKLTIGNASIWLAGFDDIWAGHPDYRKALQGIRYQDICIALAHNPDAILSIRGKPVDLLLTGHTHGGQVRLPFIGALESPTKLPRKYAAGLFRFGRTRLYVTRGIGREMPIRFLCRPEVPEFVLHSDFKHEATANKNEFYLRLKLVLILVCCFGNPNLRIVEEPDYN